MTVVGVVAEGVHDYPTIEKLAEISLPSTFIRPLKFRRLQPDADASNGGHPDGGWARVIGWCRRYCSDGLSTLFSPIEEDDEPCEAIIIHLDGDAVNPCSNFSAEGPLPNGCPATDRVEKLNRMVFEWLAPDANHSRRLVVAVPVMDTEAWIMAALDPTTPDWETRTDAKTRFRGLKPRTRSVADHYEYSATAVAAGVQHIRQQCTSFTRFENSCAQLGR
jgi:hypothetical protein